MNKVKLLIAGIVLLASNTSNAQAVGMGNVIADAYYGVPNLMKFSFESVYINNNNNNGSSGTYDAKNVDFTGVGPTGLRAEFMLTDKFGIGTDTWFSGMSVAYDQRSDQDSLVYHYKASFNRTNALVAFNIHFGDGEKLDVYTSLGVGYAHRKFIYETNDPHYAGDETRRQIAPIGMRLGFGMRYFPIAPLGFSAAIGIGGPLLSFGVVTKF